jgi:hypothetical protein
MRGGVIDQPGLFPVQNLHTDKRIFEQFFLQKFQTPRVLSVPLNGKDHATAPQPGVIIGEAAGFLLEVKRGKGWNLPPEKVSTRNEASSFSMYRVALW